MKAPVPRIGISTSQRCMRCNYSITNFELQNYLNFPHYSTANYELRTILLLFAPPNEVKSRSSYDSAKRNDCHQLRTRNFEPSHFPQRRRLLRESRSQHLERYGGNKTAELRITNFKSRISNSSPTSHPFLKIIYLQTGDRSRNSGG